jgi:hypothetical protein
VITRFRIEAKGNSNEDVRTQLEQISIEIMNRLRVGYNQGSNGVDWECTQDVISGSGQNYQGRMIFVYRGADND